MTDPTFISRPERDLARLKAGCSRTVPEADAMEARFLELLVETEAALYEGFWNCGFDPESLWAEPFQKTTAILNEYEA